LPVNLGVRLLVNTCHSYSSGHMKNLHELIGELELLAVPPKSGETSTLFVEVFKNSHETVLAANKEGLVHLALQILRLADKATDGAHFHIDESSIADRAEVSVVLTYREAPWA
jgi:hypothetical protein